MRTIIAAALAGAAFIAVPAGAQTAPDGFVIPDAPATDHRVTESIDGGVANGANDTQLKSSDGFDFQLLSAADKKVASLSFTFRGEDPDMNLVKRDSDGKYGFAYTDFTLTASGALDDDGGDTTLLGLDGFTGGTEVKLAVKHYWGAFGFGSDLAARKRAEDEEIAKAVSNCQKAPQNRFRKPDEVAKECGTGNDAAHSASTLLAIYNPEGEKRVQLKGTIGFFGAELKGNQDNYKFLRRATFTTGKESHFGYGGSIFGGVIVPNALASVTGAFTWSRRYKAADAVTLCQPIAAPLSQCITAPDGAPTASNNAIFSIEVRKAFTLKAGRSAALAFAPKASIDATSGDYSLDMPVYFAGDGKGKLRGGVRGIYTNLRDATTGRRKGDFTLALFVGVPFSFFH